MYGKEFIGNQFFSEVFTEIQSGSSVDSSPAERRREYGYGWREHLSASGCQKFEKVTGPTYEKKLMDI